MFNRIPFRKEHLSEMLKQPMNADNARFFRKVDFKFLEHAVSFTGLWNGKPVVCGGVNDCWAGRGYLWTVFDEDSKHHFVPVFRGVQKFLADLTPLYNRLEIAIPWECDIGKRRAKLLGFHVELERAVRFLPDGRDCTLFVKFGRQAA